jgi:hypothetical protein
MDAMSRWGRTKQRRCATSTRSRRDAANTLQEFVEALEIARKLVVQPVEE